MYSHPTVPYAPWPEVGHYLLPVYSHPTQPFTLTWRFSGGQPEAASQVEYHHYYGLNPWSLPSTSWQYQLPHVGPVVAGVNHAPARPLPQGKESWPEGSTLQVELRWGQLQRVYGRPRDLPDFVRGDLRRAYGTYPRTDVSITYRGGEYLVRGDPHVGEQEYKVEKKVVHQLESPHQDGSSELVEGRKKKK